MTKRYFFRNIILGSILCIALLGNVGKSQASSIEPLEESKQPLVLQNVKVVDVRSGEVSKGQWIVITDNKISYIGDKNKMSLPKNAKIRDASGQYVIPGLWDMHVHLLQDQENAFPLLLGNGVTGVRDMGSEIKNIDLWKNSIQDGIAAPRIEYAGPALNQSNDSSQNTSDTPSHHLILKTEEEARKAVRTIAATGANHVKVYSDLQPSVFAAVMDEAKKYRLTVGGHVPKQVRAMDAIRLGMKSIEHTNEMFIATSSIESDLLKNPLDGGIEEKAIENYDQGKAEKLFQEFVRNEVWHVPTLVAFMNSASGILNGLNPDAIYAPTAIQKQWIQSSISADELDANIRAEIQNQLDSMNKDYGEMVRKMNAANVPLLAGTDSTFLISNSIYGKSLHDELELLVENGLTPLQALQSATINPAKYLKRVNELGTVEEGKLADLVILDANPLEDIRNTTRISAVILDGKLMEKQKLDKAIKKYKLVKQPS